MKRAGLAVAVVGAVFLWGWRLVGSAWGDRREEDRDYNSYYRRAR